MASKSQKFNASVNFGATVDPSMTRSLNRLTSGIDNISTKTAHFGRVQTAWQRQMKAGSASTTNQIKHMERATQALITKHEALEKEIREAVKSGRAGTAFLIEDYKKVGLGIENARKELERLNREQEAEAREEARRARRQAAMERLRAAPMHGLRSGIRGAWTVGGRALSFGAGVIGLSGAASIAGSFGSVLGLNHKTAEEYRQAKQYGMSYQHYKTGSILAEQAGLNGENYGDLSEELSNKLGTEGNDKTINPLLWQIGIAGKNALKGTKEQQFNKVMQAISKAVLNKHLSAQQGESLADQLMGGEANKLMTYIISTKKSYEGVMRDAAELNNVSEDEARAALKSSQTISNLWTSAETAMQGIAGELGDALGPQLDAWEKQATAWIHEHKGEISKSIGSWVDGGGPERMVRGFEHLGRIAWNVAKKMEMIIPDDSPETDIRKEARNRAYIAGGQAESEANSSFLAWPARVLGGRKKFIDEYVDEHAPTFETMLGAQDTPESIPNIPLRRDVLQNNHKNVTNNYAVTFNLPQTDDPQAFATAAYGHFRQMTGKNDIGGSNTFDPPEF